VRRRGATALSRLDGADLKREEVRGNGKVDRTRREWRPPWAVLGGVVRELAGVPQRSRPVRRRDDRAQSRSGNLAPPLPGCHSRLPKRPSKRQVCPAN